MGSRFDLPGACAKAALRSAGATALIGLSLAIAAPLAAQPAGTGVGSQFELVFWQSVAASDDPDQYQAYLSRYPEGTFAAVARAKIERLRPSSAQPAGPPPPLAAPAAAPAPRMAAPVAAAPAPVVAVPGPIAAAPAPVALPVATPSPAPVSASTPVPAPAPPPAPASAPVPVPAPVQIAAPAPLTPAPPSLADQLAAIARSQGRQAESAPAGHAGMPSPPELPAPDPVNVPAQFCSAVERNAFYDEQFRPSKDGADENNRRAIAHLQALQALYDQLGRQGDPDGQNAVSAEAKAYQPVAASAYQVSAGYDRVFQQMMAVPIVACAPPAAAPASGRKRP